MAVDVDGWKMCVYAINCIVLIQRIGEFPILINYFDGNFFVLKLTNTMLKNMGMMPQAPCVSKSLPSRQFSKFSSIIRHSRAIVVSHASCLPSKHLPSRQVSSFCPSKPNCQPHHHHSSPSHHRSVSCHAKGFGGGFSTGSGAAKPKPLSAKQACPCGSGSSYKECESTVRETPPHF